MLEPNTNGHTLLTTEEAMLLLSVTRQTIRNMVARNELIVAKRTKRGKQTRPYFFKQDVLALKATRNPEAD